MEIKLNKEDNKILFKYLERHNKIASNDDKLYVYDLDMYVEKILKKGDSFELHGYYIKPIASQFTTFQYDNNDVEKLENEKIGTNVEIKINNMVLSKIVMNALREITFNKLLN